MTSHAFRAGVLAATLLCSTAPAALADGAYLRVDGGAQSSTSNGGDIYRGTGFGTDFGNSPVIGGGVGYSFDVTPLITIRGDLTVTGEPAFVKTASATVGTGGAASTLAGKLNLNATQGLISGYVDFNTATMFTPYLGVGLGVSENNLQPINYTILQLSTGNRVAAGTQAGSKIYTFAAVAMAGVSVDILPKIKLDLAYRYSNAGDVRTSGYITSPSGIVTALQSQKGTLESHGVTLGVRFTM